MIWYGLTLMTVGTLSDTVYVFDTAFTVSVLAHKVDSWQIELSLTVVTCLLVIEIDRSLFHLGDFLLAVAYFSNFFVFASVVLVNALLLSFEILKQERFDYAKWQLLVGFKDLEHKERR